MLTALLTCHGLALADDGGQHGTTTDGSTEGSEGESSGDAARREDGAVADDAAIVIACDGALCDSLQGRPSCAVAASPRAGIGGLACVAVGAGLCVVRRRRRGAVRPPSRVEGCKVASVERLPKTADRRAVMISCA
jgi:hypothetical protein